MERGPNDFVEAARERGDFDRLPEQYGVERRRREKPTNWLAIGTALFAVVFQIGTLLYYGGRLTQRVDTIEAVQLEERQRDARIAEENGKQNVTLGIIVQQNDDSARRLGSIEAKIERLNQR